MLLGMPNLIHIEPIVKVIIILHQNINTKITYSNSSISSELKIKRGKVGQGKYLV